MKLKKTVKHAGMMKPLLILETYSQMFILFAFSDVIWGAVN